MPTNKKITDLQTVTTLQPNDKIILARPASGQTPAQTLDTSLANLLAYITNNTPPPVQGPGPNTPDAMLVLVLGDSIPAGKLLGDGANQNYIAQGIDIDDVGYDVLNFAVAGESVFGLQATQIPAAIAAIDFTKYSKIVMCLHVGINDLRTGASPYKVYTEQKRICKLFKGMGCSTILVGCLAFNDTADSANNDPILVEELRQKLTIKQRSKMQTDLELDAYVDMAAHPILGRYVGREKINTDYFNPDGVHPTFYGAEEMALDFVPAIAAIRNGNTYGTPSTPNNVSLSALTFGPGVSSSPPFEAAQSSIIYEHNISVDDTVTTLPIIPTATDATATLQIDDVPVTGGVGKTVDLTIGENHNTIRVEKGLNSRIYRINTTVGLIPTIPIIFTSCVNLNQYGVDGWQAGSNGPGYGVTSKKRAAGTKVIVQFSNKYENGMAIGLDGNNILNQNKDTSGNFSWEIQVLIDNNGHLIVCQGSSSTDLGQIIGNDNLYRITLKDDDTAILSLSTDNIIFNQIHAFTGNFPGIKYIKSWVEIYPFNLFLVRENGLI